MNRTRQARVETLVRTVFGLSALRPGQQEVIDAVLSKQHTLAIVVYAQTALCRTRLLLEALGEAAEWAACGTCDNCRGVSIRAEAVAMGAA